MMKTEDRLLSFACWFSLLMYCYASEHSERSNRTFRCHSHTEDTSYIRNDFFCDGYEQCNDGEDELFGCKNKGNNTCGKSKFSCDNGQCKNITVRCNTINECNDGTDELNCGDEINVKNCTSEDKFLCHDGLRCLGLEYTCDGSCNCFDCSDENENCSKKDDNLMKRCPHAYFATADGPKCFCDPNNNSSKTLCDSVEDCEHARIKISEDNKMDLCEQRCIKYKSRRQCACYEGYYMVGEGYGSECISSDNFTILYLNSHEIKTANNTYYNTSTILHGISNGTLLTAANDYVYYATLSQDNKGSIFKASLHFGKPEKLIETDYAITSIEADYITNNIYFTGNGSLSVCTTNGTIICTQLKCCNVTYLTLAPKYGWIFYMQMNTHHQMFCKNRSFLTRSNMDGSNETFRANRCYSGKIIVEMDESRNMLYLLEERNEDEWYTESRLHAISFIDSTFEEANDLSDKISFEHTPINMQRISFYKNEVFFTNKDRNGIFSYRNLPQAGSTTWFSSFNLDALIRLNDSSTNITDVYVYNAAIQHSNENPCEKLPLCSGLCLLKRQTHPSQFFLSRTCICEGFIPTEESHWCSNHYGANYGFVWVVVLGILVFVVLGITGYYMLVKGNWLRYYLTLRHWRRWESERDEVMVFSDQEK